MPAVTSFAIGQRVWVKLDRLPVYLASVTAVSERWGFQSLKLDLDDDKPPPGAPEVIWAHSSRCERAD